MTVSTEAEDRFPRWRRLFQEADKACGGRPRLLSMALRTFGPPLWKMKLQILSHAEIVVGEEIFDGVREARVLTSSGTSAERTMLKPLWSDLPPHQVLGIGIEGGAGIDDTRTGLFDACGLCWPMRCLFPGENDGGGAVSEESAGDQVGHGVVVLLPGERAEFDGEQESVLVGEGAHVVDGAGDSCGSGDAAEAEDWGALDVLRKAHAG